MTVFTKLGNDIFSPVNADGSQRSVVNQDAQVWSTEVERLIDSAFEAGGGLLFTSKSNLDGVLSHGPATMAWVMGDPTVGSDGIYQKLGASGSGSWVRRGDLPYSFIKATNAGAGTANAIVATSSIPVPVADGGALITVNVTADNTGPATISFNGGAALPIKSNSGNDIVAGGLKIGMILSGYASGGTFRLLSDQASAAIQAAAEAAAASASADADRVEAAAAVASGSMTTVLDPQFATKATAEAWVPPVGGAPDYIRTAGYSAAGDGGGALYKKVASEPSHAGKLSITLADGVTLVWYEISEPVLSPEMFGAVGDGVADDTLALQNLHACCIAIGSEFLYQKKTHWVRNNLVVKSNGDMSAATIVVDASDFQALADKVVLLIGNRSVRQHRLTVSCPERVFNREYVIGSGVWTGFEDTVGIEFAHINHGHLDSISAFGFGKDVLVSAYVYGNVYSHYFLKSISSGKVNLHLFSGGESGWVNENNFYGGSVGSGIPAEVPGTCRLVLDKDLSNIYLPPNNNRFFGVSFEGDNQEYIMKLHGRTNGFYNCRYEGDGAKKILLASTEARGNVFSGGHSLNEVEFEVSPGETPYGNVMVGGLSNVLSGQYEALRLGTLNATAGSTAFFTCYPAPQEALTKTRFSIDWTRRLDTIGFRFKEAGDAYDRSRIQNGSIFLGTGAAEPGVYLTQTGNSTLLVNGHLASVTDNSALLGTSAGRRWAGGYLAAAMTVTSDAREKDWRGGLTDAELRVAGLLSKLIGIYRWKDAVAAKGDDARLHCGVKAQEVEAAFASEGFDGFDYGVLCYDEWDATPAEHDEDGQEIVPAVDAGNRYGIRYDELWAFIAAGFEARLEAIESDFFDMAPQ